MKKTLLITLEYPPQVGGVANYYKNLVGQLPHDKIRVLTNDSSELLSTSKYIWPKWLKGLTSVYRAIKLHDIEHLLVGQILPVGTIALILNFFLKTPYTVMTHAMDITLPYGTEGSKRKQWLVKKILSRAVSITTVSNFTKNKLMELGVKASKIILIHPCPNLDGTQHHVPQEKLSELDHEYNLTDKRVILSVGRLVKRKGIDAAIQAMAKIQKEHENVIYAIVGAGPYEADLKQQVKKLDLEKRIIFVGKVDDRKLSLWYARCEVFLMPSRVLDNHDVEGFGMVFLEANSYGKPVIGGRSGGVSDAVIDGKTGHLVEPTDINMLVNALKQILSDESKAIRLGHQGRERVKEVFQWRVQAEKLQKILT